MSRRDQGGALRRDIQADVKGGLTSDTSLFARAGSIVTTMEIDPHKSLASDSQSAPEREKLICDA